ncbi:uncharacterized protein [Dermacentor albipictus]|uniref:uncharacterized protein isoform X1 n=1 Tax=Dermacentor albipictus TaxID=60249 RepID=UPI0031FCEEB7
MDVALAPAAPAPVAPPAQVTQFDVANNEVFYEAALPLSAGVRKATTTGIGEKGFVKRAITIIILLLIVSALMAMMVVSVVVSGFEAGTPAALMEEMPRHSKKPQDPVKEGDTVPPGGTPGKPTTTGSTTLAIFRSFLDYLFIYCYLLFYYYLFLFANSRCYVSLFFLSLTGTLR